MGDAAISITGKLFDNGFNLDDEFLIIPRFFDYYY
jgi:hypothetical protein